MNMTKEQETLALSVVNDHSRSLVILACANVARLKIAGLPPEAAVAICVQALLNAAVGLVSTARMSGDVTSYPDDALIDELRRLQGLDSLVIELLPDGTFSNPQAIN